MSHKYTLIYFNGRGRGEIARLIFAAAGAEYVDKRVEFSEWPAMKPSTPWKCLPILEVDGVVIGESLALSRFLARKFGLQGKTDVEQALVEGVVEAAAALYVDYFPMIFGKDAKKKAEITEKYLNETAPAVLKNLEEFLSSNNEGGGFFVGQSLTWADLTVLYALDTLFEINTKFEMTDFPKMMAHRKRIESLPKIAEYLKKRPNTTF